MNPTQDVIDAERALAYVTMTDGCWQWTGPIRPSGYGYFNIGADSISAHRWMYELITGPIPNGLVIDHLCRNRACVRPSHLEAVTNHENILRGIGPSAQNAAKQRCPKGHDYSLRIAGKAGRTTRYCRICAREKARTGMALSRKRRTASVRANCSACHLPYAVKADGTVYRHNGLDAAGFNTGQLCPGAGQPPAAD